MHQIEGSRACNREDLLDFREFHLNTILLKNCFLNMWLMWYKIAMITSF
jgi:hypothetical protein